ncbi:MAG: UDP-N-acetylmuramoyl-L-alanyl-D-glutamate--2,6-diaminopimelate ligase [Candidatus Marinimicrobia bacterium]|nr:UDP-N-acetylmuramoyl-L-alanyl-D-glutamate--2,6-diaminopimelate ligase [Candidatus Neomarinimicrobiota bacterium]
MLLQNILHNIKYKTTMQIDDININKIEYDSRKINKNDLFIAIKGDISDGHLFINSAIKNGAIAIIVSEKKLDISVPQIIVDDDRKTLAQISSNFYKTQIEPFDIYGITGTNGKTTTALILKYLLNFKNRKSGYIGTLGIQAFKEYKKNLSLTTPESLDIYKTIFNFKTGQIESAVIEVSSIALDRKRVYQIPFKIALFTNLSQDHLDYHRTMSAYFEAKKTLFQQIKKDGFAIINIDDNYGKKLFGSIKSQKKSFSLNNNKADYYFETIDYNIENTTGIIHSPFGKINIQFPLLGSFNAYNLLGAIASQLSLFPNDYSKDMNLKTLPPIPGRMEIIKTKQHGTAIVDFAHTPDAMEKIFNTIKIIQKTGKINIAFGCGGNRDKTKRPMMGKIASENADEIILTNDNPRDENPLAIIDDIKKDVKTNYQIKIIENRKNAIAEILRVSNKNDVVLILGKGDEREMEIDGKKIPFDDRKIINSWIKKNEN